MHMSKDYQRDEENLSVETGESHTLKQIFVPILPAVIIIGLIIAIIKILGFVPGLSFTETEWFGYLDMLSNIGFGLIVLIVAVSAMRTLSGRKAAVQETEGEAPAMAAPAAETASAAPDSKQIDLVVMRCDEGDVKAPVPGKLRSYTEIPDEAFASGVLGEGVGITPEEEEIYAPFDGTVTTLAESKHAIGLTGPGGMELLIHVGVDTVMMNGDGFEPRVKEGDKVTCGQPLMHFDRKKIKAAGHPDVVVVLMTNSDDLTNFRIML